MKTKEYTVFSRIDFQEYGSFKTRKEAQDRIAELKRQDKELGNPFDEGYFIKVETFDY